MSCAQRADKQLDMVARLVKRSGETDGRHLCLPKLHVGALLLVVQPHMTN